MRTPFKELKKYTVQTVSGTVLGKVRDIVLDVDAQTIVQYDVGTIVPGSATYRVHRDQVKAISDKTIIVYDTITPVSSTQTVRGKSPASPEPVAMRDAQ